MKLLALYESILKMANLTVTDDGCISLTMGDESKPAIIKGKRLVMPTPEHLANPDRSTRIIFHPLSENILRGESDVLEMYRNALNLRINFTFGMLALELLTIAGSVGEHAKLSPDQSEFLSKVKNVDDKTLDVLKRIFKAMPPNQTQKCFVSIYLKRSGLIPGLPRHSRYGVVNFPLYEELQKSTTECYGVKMRVKDREALLNLMEFMIPGIETPHSHTRGSDSVIAPFIDALMRAALSVAGPLNSIIDLFANQLDDGDADKLRFEDSWVETFENLDVMQNEIRMVPMQAGNEGSTNKNAPTPVGSPAITQLAITPVAAPVPAAPATHAPVQWPPQPQPQSQYYAPAPMAPPEPVRTNRGVDFASLQRLNPALGGGQPQFQQGQQRASLSNPQSGGGWNTGYPQQQNSWPQGGGWGNQGGGSFGNL